MSGMTRPMVSVRFKRRPLEANGWEQESLTCLARARTVASVCLLMRYRPAWPLRTREIVETDTPDSSAILCNVGCGAVNGRPDSADLDLLACLSADACHSVNRFF